MAYKLYQVKHPPQLQYLKTKEAQVRYLYDLACDRVDGCQIDGREFVETPRVFDRRYTNSSTQTVTVETINPDDTFHQGSILFYDNDYWMCMSCFKFHDLYLKGLFQRCNYKLRWQNESGQIIERWVISQDASSYSNGVEGNKTLRYGSDQIMIYISCDKDTVGMPRDKRFMIDCNADFPTTYTLTRIDTTSRTVQGVGYCIWLLTESQLNHKTDNIELMLCDYFVSESRAEMDIITYTGKSQIRSGGVAKKFAAETKENVSWSLRLMVEQKDYIILEDVGNNQCQIRCLSNNSLIGTSFKLIAECASGTQELLIDVVGGV